VCTRVSAVCVHESVGGVCARVGMHNDTHCSVLQCVAVRCSRLRCVAVCCSVL